MKSTKNITLRVPEELHRASEKKNITVRIPIDIYQSLEAKSVSMGFGVSDLMLIAIWNSVLQNEGMPPLLHD